MWFVFIRLSILLFANTYHCDSTTDLTELSSRSSVISTLNGCAYERSAGLYVYGPVVDTIRDVESSDECARRCWKYRFRNQHTTTTGDDRCEAVNFLQSEKRCELMREAFDIHNPGMMKYYGLDFPDSSYLQSIDCAPDPVCGRTLIDPMANYVTAPNLRIVGGTEAVPHSIPWIVSLRRGFTSSKRHACGGALIRRDDDDETDLVLTAAHCRETDIVELSDYYVIVVGGHDLDNPDDEYEKRVTVDKFELHESYNEDTSENDIAIIKLTSSVKFNRAVQPVCLPKAGERLLDGTLGIIAGWGTTKFGDPQPHPYLQYLFVPIVNDAICISYFQTNSTASDGTPDPKLVDEKMMICAGYPEGGRDTCQGDSGGPLAFKSSVTGNYVLHGLVSFGTRCAEVGLVGVYTRVSSYIDWINTKIDEMKT